MKISDYNQVNKSIISSWDEGLPLGNGQIGCLIYGDKELRFAIDRIDLWDKRQCETSKGKNFNYKTFVKCVQEGELGWKEKERIFEFNHKYPYPTKLSGGRIELFFGEELKSFNSILNIEKAKAEVKTNSVKFESFICATKNIGVIKIKGDYKLNLHIPNYFSSDKDCLNYPCSKVINEGEFTFYNQKTLTEYGFALIVLTKKKEFFDEIYYTIVTSDDNNDYINYGKNLLIENSKLGYDILLDNHEKWWKKYWKKSHINIPDKELMKSYYTSWYLFASTSRKDSYPMPLQGVWTADNDKIPPWNGDYHYDTNVQMSYWGYGRANRLDEGKVLVDYLWNNRKTFKSFAKSFYDVNGYLLPACATIDAKPMGGWTQFALSPTMTIWAAKAFSDYYFVTGDKTFLRKKAFPFLENVAKAMIELFIEKNGKYYLPVSTSPEIYEGEYTNTTIGNTNFDQALILYLFYTLKQYCELLNVSSNFYDEILSKLDDLYVVNGKLSLSEKFPMPYSHRHHSHLMGIYPLRLLNTDVLSEKNLIEKSVLELEQLGTGWWVGFSFPWCANLYNTIGNGNAAYEKLRMFVQAFLSPNGFHLNGDYKNKGLSQWHYRPFTLEALFSYCDSLQSMLFEDYKGYIELFPSIPDEWKNKRISFKNFLSDGCLFSAKYSQEKIISFSIKSKIDKKISIKNTFGKNKLVFSNGQVIKCEVGNIFVLNLAKGKCELQNDDVVCC